MKLPRSAPNVVVLVEIWLSLVFCLNLQQKAFSAETILEYGQLADKIEKLDFLAKNSSLEHIKKLLRISKFLIGTEYMDKMNKKLLEIYQNTIFKHDLTSDYLFHAKELAPQNIDFFDQLPPILSLRAENDINLTFHLYHIFYQETKNRHLLNFGPLIPIFDQNPKIMYHFVQTVRNGDSAMQNEFLRQLENYKSSKIYTLEFAIKLRRPAQEILVYLDDMKNQRLNTYLIQTLVNNCLSALISPIHENLKIRYKAFSILIGLLCSASASQFQDAIVGLMVEQLFIIVNHLE